MKKKIDIIEVEGKPNCKNDTPKHIQPNKEKAEQSQDGKQ